MTRQTGGAIRVARMNRNRSSLAFISNRANAYAAGVPISTTSSVDTVHSRKDVTRLWRKPSLITYSKWASVGSNRNTVGRANITSVGLTTIVAIQNTGNRISAP